MGFFMGMTVSTAALTLHEPEVMVRWARFRYNFTDHMTALLRAQLRLEDGPRGQEAGLKFIAFKRYTDKGDPQALADSTAPEGSEQYSRLARRINRQAQREVFSDEWTRNRFLRRHAKRYVGNGVGPGGTTGKKAHRAYYLLLKKLYLEELPIVQAGFDPIDMDGMHDVD